MTKKKYKVLNGKGVIEFIEETTMKKAENAFAKKHKNSSIIIAHEV